MGVTTATRPAARRARGPVLVRQAAPERVRSCALEPSERSWPREQAVADCPVRLTRRGRFVVTIGVGIVAVVLIALAGFAALRVAPPADASTPVRTTTVMVEPGQTLWQLAESAAPSADPREVVDQIMRLNGIKDAGAVQAGTRLRVPVTP